jgi:membrane-associated phospholipid phosphatase
MKRFHATGLLAAAMVSVSVQAFAQTSGSSVPCGVPSTKGLFTGAVEGLRQVPSRESAAILATGLTAALGVHPADDAVRRAGDRTTDAPFRAGAIIGGAPVQLGVPVAAYVIGRLGGHPCAARLGADLIEAQALAAGMTVAIKQATRRSRPEGSGFSFPSGHASAAFASATVLQRHFGWKVGVPAYAVAGYVAASRVEMSRHFLSDVAFGAAVGIVAGRTVTIGRTHRLAVVPIATPDGAGVGVGVSVLR